MLYPPWSFFVLINDVNKKKVKANILSVIFSSWNSLNAKKHASCVNQSHFHGDQSLKVWSKTIHYPLVAPGDR